MIWTCEVPLPPQWCRANNPVASTGARIAKSIAEKAYKAKCAEILAACPVRAADHVVVHMTWYCVNDPSQKAQPNKRGKVTLTARMAQPYYARDSFNAAAAAKHIVDAIPEVGIVKDDTWACVSVGSVRGYMTGECRFIGIYKPCIELKLEIIEDPFEDPE